MAHTGEGFQFCAMAGEQEEKGVLCSVVGWIQHVEAEGTDMTEAGPQEEQRAFGAMQVFFSH